MSDEFKNQDLLKEIFTQMLSNLEQIPADEDFPLEKLFEGNLIEELKNLAQGKGIYSSTTVLKTIDFSFKE